MIRPIGDTVRTLREAEGLSIEELAHRCEVPADVLAALERGEPAITTTQLAAVAAVFAIDRAALLRGSVVAAPVPSLFLRQAPNQDFREADGAVLDEALEQGRGLVRVSSLLAAPLGALQAGVFEGREVAADRPEAPAQDAYRLARAVRRWLGIGAEPIGDLGELIEARWGWPCSWRNGPSVVSSKRGSVTCSAIPLRTRACRSPHRLPTYRAQRTFTHPKGTCNQAAPPVAAPSRDEGRGVSRCSPLRSLRRHGRCASGREGEPRVRGRNARRLCMLHPPMEKAKSPLRAILDIRRDELPLSLLMFAYFFLVITTFWILKPIKKTVFIQFYDHRAFELFDITLKASQSELLAKVLNMVVAFGGVVLFTWLARRLVRQQLTLAFSAMFGLGFVLYAVALGSENAITVWSFYLYGDLYSTVMVATFFAFLNDAVDPSAARRLYGLIVLGGVAGGVFGSTFMRVWIDTLSNSSWMFVCLGIGAMIAGAAAWAGKLVPKRPDADPPPASEHPTPPSAPGNPAFEGAKLVFRSPYLLSVVAIVGLYEIVSTILDFQFTETIAHYLDGDAIGKQFANVYAITNCVSLVVQLLFTSYVMSRFRLTVSLLVLPVAVLLGSAGFLLLPLLWVGSSLNTVDNALSYSINQSAREALYTPTSRDEKYKAKAFIDMFVQRVAKAVAVGVALLVTMFFTDFSSLRWLSLFTIGIVVVWSFAARYAGKSFHRLSARP